MEIMGMRVIHTSPGRMRLKVDDIKHNPDRAREIEDQLRIRPGVHSADANPLTGSLLLTFDEATWQTMELPFSLAQVLGISLNDLDPNEWHRLMAHDGKDISQLDNAIAKQFEDAMKELNSSVQRLVGADLRTMLPLLLALLGVRNLLTSQKPVLPSWPDYFWFAFSTYFMLNRTTSGR